MYLRATTYKFEVHGSEPGLSYAKNFGKHHFGIGASLALKHTPPESIATHIASDCRTKEGSLATITTRPGFIFIDLA